MQNMSPIQTFSIALEIRAGRIPVRWTARDHHVTEVQDANGRVLMKGGTERVLWPEVETTKWGDTAIQDIDDPSDIRAALFHALNTNWSEGTALALLNRVGAWRIGIEDGTEQEWQKGTFASVAYRHRSAFRVRVLPVELDDMRRTALYWYDLLGSPKDSAKQRAAFRHPPQADATPAQLHSFAWEARFTNTLPVSLEWSGKEPRAVIEPICGFEILAAAAWADVAARVPSQVCERCNTRFSCPRKKKYCRWECGHAVAVMNYKRKRAREGQSS
jgi:hypothetical protein